MQSDICGSEDARGVIHVSGDGNCLFRSIAQGASTAQGLCSSISGEVATKCQRPKAEEDRRSKALNDSCVLPYARNCVRRR